MRYHVLMETRFGRVLQPEQPGFFPIAYSPNFRDKTVLPTSTTPTPFIDGFKQKWVDYAGLKKIVIDSGYAIARPFQGSKKDGNVTLMSYIGFDFDAISEEMFERIKENPFVKGRGFFHYSASHGIKPGINGHWICPLEYPIQITGEEELQKWKFILRELVTITEGSDRKTSDPSRLFFGAYGQKYEIWGDGRITLAEIDELYSIIEARVTLENKIKNTKRKNKRVSAQFTYEQAEQLTAQYVVPNLLADGSFPAVMGLDSYYCWLGYFLGWANELGLEQAAELMDTFAPDSQMGSLRKLKSFDKESRKDRSFSFGTTMLLLRYWGYEPEASMNPIIGKPEIVADRIVDTSGRYLLYNDIASDKKCVLVQSPKGSGKTELIKTIIAQGERVIVIGHSRALLKATAERTGLRNYLDGDITTARSLVITVNSLHKLDLRLQQFDCVIIDESEQLGRHLIGDTLKDNRAAALGIFHFILETSGKVYMFDADLSQVSINLAQRTFGRDNVEVIQNTVAWNSRLIEMYPTPEDIQFMTLQELKLGKKLVYASNSKNEIDAVSQMLREEIPDIRLLAITQDNSDQVDIQDFIASLSDAENTRIRDLDVLLFSPSVGTGVSIVSEYFDAVHLVGVANVTTHFDLDQQQNRVRIIKENKIRAYVARNSGYEQTLEIDSTVLKKLCVMNARETGIKISISDEPSTFGEVTAETSDGWYLELWSDITALRHLSLNNLEANYIKLMEDNGHTVIWHKVELAHRLDTKNKITASRAHVLNTRVTDIIEAADIENIEYEILTNNPLQVKTAGEKLVVAKHELKRYYNIVALDPVLVTADLTIPAFRERLKFMEMLVGLVSPEAVDERERQTNKGLRGLESRVMIPHREFYGLKKAFIGEFLERAGLPVLALASLRNYGEQTWYSSRTLAGFVAWVSQPVVRDNLKRLFGMTVRVNIDKQPTGLLNEMLSRILLFELEYNRKRGSSQGSAVTNYRVMPTSAAWLHEVIKQKNSPVENSLTELLKGGYDEY